MKNKQEKQREKYATLLHDRFAKVESDYSILRDMVDDYNRTIDLFNATVTTVATWLDGTEWKDTQLEYLETLERPHNPSDTAASDASDTLRRLQSG